MARIRSIKPEFPQSESMGRVSRDARLLFILLWPLCDDHGRTRASSRMLASLLFPYDNDAPQLMDGWLDELEREGCIVRYTVEGSTYLHIPKWLIHQKIDKPSKPQHPNPPETPSTIREDSRDIRETSSEEGKGREGKGKGKEEEKKTRTRVPKPELTLTGWLDTLADGSFAIPPEDPIFDWASKAGIPPDWIDLAWRAFADRYGPNGASKAKRYADWRAVFRTAVKDDWLHVWRHTPQGFVLTTVGETWKRAA